MVARRAVSTAVTSADEWAAKLAGPLVVYSAAQKAVVSALDWVGYSAGCSEKLLVAPRVAWKAASTAAQTVVTTVATKAELMVAWTAED